MKETAKVLFSVDLDGTLRYGWEVKDTAKNKTADQITLDDFVLEISLTNIKAWKKAEELGLPTEITTARTGGLLVSETLEDMKNIENNSQLKAYQFYLQAHTFKFLIQTLKQYEIENPAISTTYDPLLPDLNGKYYESYDQISEYILLLIRRTLAGSIDKDTLVNHLSEILRFMGSPESDNEIDEEKIVSPCADDFAKIKDIILQERQLVSHVNKDEKRKNSSRYKQRQFLDVCRKNSCNMIVHVDDLPEIYQHYNQVDEKNIQFTMRRITSTTHGTQVYVYCIPFNKDPQYQNSIFAAIQRGLNYPMEQIKENLEDLRQKFPPPYSCCGLTLWSWNHKETATILNVLRVLNQISISFKEDKSSEEKVQLPPKICLSTYLPLLNILNQIPFSRLERLNNPSLKKLQQELARLQVVEVEQPLLAVQS